MNAKIILPIIFILFGCLYIHATTYTADPTDYLDFRGQLVAGDTLLLSSGNYTNGLRLTNINGTSDNWIVIKSEVPYEAVLLGRAENNTMDITNCSYLKIEGLKFDGQNIDYIDAIKASGDATMWSHHIWVHNNIITGHDSKQQTCGISTKITCWDWTISYNKIMSAGTGIYLGNSDGSMPFIHGIIEYNLILNPVGYCMQIKHQNDRHDLQGIPKTATSTIVRHNVFAKNDPESPDGDRPNVLFGGQTLTGATTDDRIECYGNFFFNNPREFLLQATGNVSVHDNIFVNSPSGAMNFQRHNSRDPKEVFVYCNSIYNVGTGVRISNPIPTKRQFILANAIFANIPIDAQTYDENILDAINKASLFFINPDSVIENMDFYPKKNTPIPDVDFTVFMWQDIDWDKDFNGNPQNGTFFGAYSGAGTNPGWKLALDIKGSGVTKVEDETNKVNDILVYPNPVQDEFTIRGINSDEIESIVLTDLPGNEVVKINKSDLKFNESNYTITIGKENLSKLCNGMYILRVNCNREISKTAIIHILK